MGSGPSSSAPDGSDGGGGGGSSRYLDGGQHGGGGLGGRSSSSRAAGGTSSLRHDSSGLTEGGGQGRSSRRQHQRSSSQQQQGQQLQPGQPGYGGGGPTPTAPRVPSIHRRSDGGGPGQYEEAAHHQHAPYGGPGAYSPPGASPVAGQSPRRAPPGPVPAPAVRSVSGGSARGGGGGPAPPSSQGSQRVGRSGQGGQGGYQQQPHHHHQHSGAAAFPSGGPPQYFTPTPPGPPVSSGGPVPSGGGGGPVVPAAASVHCLNPASEINARLDTQVEVRVYPCNNNASAAGQNPKKKFTQFTVKPEGVIIQGTNRHRSASNDLGAEYALHVGRKLQRYELSDTRACQLLVTTHNKSFWVVPAPEAFSRHSGTCRLLGDRKHPLAPHTLQVGDFLRVGSVGVVVIETHNGVENRVLSEEKIQKIMKDTTSSSGGFLDLGETDGENSDDSSREGMEGRLGGDPGGHGEAPVCYMCFDEEDTEENPLITPCKCLGDTRYVHVNCLRKWHTAEADNQICFLSSVDATCSVCKSTFKSDFKLKDGRTMKLFKSSLEPPYVSLLVATKHEMAQRLFNTRFQLSFSTLLKPDGRNATRPLLLGRSSGSDMVLDYRTVSARHASIRFKNGEFVFTDAGSSNGSYLYLRRPVELTPSQPVQFRLGRSMISMKVVNKWNRRLLRAVRRTGNSSSGSSVADGGGGDDHSVGSNEDDVRVSDGQGGATRSVPRRTRESIMRSLPAPGTLSQGSAQHLDLLYALAYPKREKEHSGATAGGGPRKKPPGSAPSSRRSSGADLGGASATTAGAVSPGAPAAGAGSMRGTQPAPLVVPAAAQPTAAAASPRGSGVGAGLLAADEESKEEVEEPALALREEEEEQLPPPPVHDGTLSPVTSMPGNDGEDEDEEEEENEEDEDEVGGSAVDSTTGEEDSTAILMMAPTAISEGSGGH